MKERAPFDDWTHGYDMALAHGLKVTGESKDFFARGRLRFLKECLGEMGIIDPHVLDLGCGTGSTTPLIFEELGARSVLGIDVSSAAIGRAVAENEFPNADYQVLDDFEPKGHIEVAYANGVFHHVPPSDRTRLAELVHDALAVGGVFAMWDNNPWSPGARYVMSRIAFDEGAIMISARQTRRMLRECGFEVLRTDYLFIFPAVLKWLRFLERPLSKLALGAQYQVLARRVV